MVEEKHCNKCNIVKSASEFHRDSRVKSGLTSYCKECQKAKSRRWYAENPERASAKSRQRYESNPTAYRESNYRRKYGIGMADYNALLLDQDNVCAICKQPERRVATTNLAVDHCHTTGEVRGLLCSNCNRALGLLNDDPEIIQSAAEYLIRWSGSRK